jgi:hypothetical protein
MLAVLIGEPIVALPALAQTSATSTATAGTLSGTITDDTGSPVSGATVSVSGPASATTTTDATGHYSLAVAPGVYRVEIRASGFSETHEDAFAVTGAGATLDARIVHPSFSSLSTIGRVTTNGRRGPAFNTGAAAESVVTAQQFEEQGDIGVRNLLEETPGIVISVSNGSANGGVRGAINYPNIRGGLSYETASLLDGHPVSVGKYGDYVTTFLNRALFQSVEVEKGPGSLPPTINRAVNGTVNFKTWDPTANLSGNFTYGLDAFGGDFSNVRISDTILNKKLGFVIDFATEGTPGAAGNTNPRTFAAGLSNLSYTDSQGVPVAVSGTTTVKAPGSTNTYTTIATNTIGCCVNIPSWYLNRSELAKLKFNFSDTTSFTASMIASQTYASQNGNNNNLYTAAFNPSIPNASIPSGNVQTFYPYNDAFAQDREFNNEPIFTGEFRTSIKNDTLIARFYSASIGRLQTNDDQSNANLTLPVQLYGTTTTGVPLNGTDPYGLSYIATVTDPLYQTMEQDNLTGYTFEYDKALGNSGNIIRFSADENYSNTHVYTPGSPDTSSTSNIPAGSAQNTATFRVIGDFDLSSKFHVQAGYYLSRFASHFPMFNTTGATTYSFGDIVNWHGDERATITYRATRNTSVRFAVGSSLVAPYLGILSGSTGTPLACTASTCPAGFQPGSVLVSTVGGGVNVKPETSFGYNLGTDYRFSQFPDTVLHADVYLTNLQNQFLRSIYANGTASDGMGHILPLYTTAYSNLANARYEGIEAKLEHAPPAGWGWAVSGSLLRGFAYNVPASVYQYNAAGQATTNQGLVAGQNFGPTSVLSSGGSAIPYATGYAEANFRSKEGWYGNVGMIYFGNNNTFNQRAFEIVRSTIRVPILGISHTYFQFAVDNLFNTNPLIFDVNSAGIPATAVGQQYVATSLKGYGPRNFHMELVKNLR